MSIDVSTQSQTQTQPGLPSLKVIFTRENKILATELERFNNRIVSNPGEQHKFLPHVAFKQDMSTGLYHKDKEKFEKLCIDMWTYVNRLQEEEEI